MKPHALDSLRILYVEDEELVRTTTETILKRRVGFVYSASNGREGWELYKKHRPDMVITDLIMHGMDGEELIKSIKSSPYPCPVILMTACDDKAWKVDEADYHLEKPVNRDELIRAIEMLAVKCSERKEKNNG